MAKSVKKGAQTGMKERTLVGLDPELHRKLKMYAAEHGSNVKALVTQAVQEFLAKIEKKS
jgi:plasmid stability protein